MTALPHAGLKVVVGVGLYGAAIAVSACATADPLKTGGAACLYASAGEVGAAAAAGAAPAGGACAPAGAAVTDMAGAAGAAPAPAGAPIPAGAPLPGGLPVPAGAGAPLPAAVPAGAPLIALGGAPGAPITEMAGVVGGKGATTGSEPSSGPIPGRPLPPGPAE